MLLGNKNAFLFRFRFRCLLILHFLVSTLHFSAFKNRSKKSRKSPIMSSTLNSVLALVLIGFLASANCLADVGKTIFTPSYLFKKCCERIEPPLRADTIEDECHFVPNNPSSDEAVDIGNMTHYNKYIKCYTNGKDNRACCQEHGVVGDFALCQVLCDGTHEHPPPPSELYKCETSYIKSNISACNRAAYLHVDEP